MQVKHGEHRDEIVFYGKEDAIREIPNERPPRASISGNWKGFWRSLAKMVVT